jgi:hypothetical protein
MRLRYAALGALAIAGALYYGAHSHPATVGIGVQAGPVRLVHSPAYPGHAYRMGECRVDNTGTATWTTSTTVEYVSPHRRHWRTLPSSWVRSGPPISLKGGNWGRISFTVRVPARARPGRYRSDVVVTPETGDGHDGDANLASASATLIIVKVVALPPTPRLHRGRLT